MKNNIAFWLMEEYHNWPLGKAGSSRIRGRWVMKYWPGTESYQIGKKYDAIIFQKVYFPDFIERYKGIKILDMCDPDMLEGAPITEAIENVDAVTVSTKPLYNLMKQLTDKPVVIIPDRIDFDEHTQVKRRFEGRAREAVWFGYSHNFTILKPCINKLKKNKIRLKIISDKGFKHADKNVIMKEWDVDKVHSELIMSDFALMPKYDKGKFIFKSNNKTLTCWALKVPVATMPEDLDRLGDPDERKREAEEKYEKVKAEFDVRKSVEQYKELIKDIKNAKTN